jgi:hypothetical protein
VSERLPFAKINLRLDRDLLRHIAAVAKDAKRSANGEIVHRLRASLAHEDTMPRRKRKHIPMIEITASALADKLHPQEREALRSLKVSARYIMRLFTPDHYPKIHAWGGEDKWWNLDMRYRGPDVKAKDAADTTRAAKAVRIDEKWDEFTRALAKHRKPPKRKSAWPKRKLSSRAKR